MSAHTSRLRTALAVMAFLAACVFSVPAFPAEPRVELRVPAFQGSRYENFSSVALPAQGHGPLELWVENALGEIRSSTLRVRLNDVPMTPFVSISTIPRGVRAVVRLGTSVNPDYSLRPNAESVLALSVEDAAGMRYQGQFYLRAEPGLTEPRVLPRREAAPVKAVEAPPAPAAPTIEIRSRWPERTAEPVLELEAEVKDAEGLKRVVLEVNGKDTDEIVLENEWPVRKHDGFMSARKLPGEVEGDGRRVRFVIPVKLGKDVTVVAVRAENTGGLRSRADLTVTRIKP